MSSFGRLTNLNPTDDSASTLPRYDLQRLLSPDNRELGGMGWANDITSSNDLYIVSAPTYYRNALPIYTSLSFSPATYTNYVYIYQNVDENWSLIQTLSTDDAGLGGETDNFGFSVSISKTDGSHIAVGTFNRSSAVARAYVFLSDGAATPTYSLEQTFISGNYGSITDATNIGYRVQLSSAGDHLLLMGTTGIIQQFSRSGTTWTHDTGDTVTASGGTSTEGMLLGLDANSDHSIIVRGSPHYPSGESTKSLQTGIVEIITGGTIGQPFTGAAGERIGSSVAISSNGLFMAYSSLGLAAELDLRTADTAGYVNIYNKPSGSTFVFQTQIVGSTVDASTGSFGSDLALSSLGNLLIIGDAYTTDFSGAQYIFTRDDDVWTETHDMGTTNVQLESQIIDSTNNILVVKENTGAITDNNVTVVNATYTGDLLAAAVATGLNASATLGGTYSVTYTPESNTFFTIDLDSGATNFTIDFLASTLNIEIGFSATVTNITTASSDSFPLLSYSGSELGRSVNVSDSLASYVSGGYPGLPSATEVKAVGEGAIFVFSTQLNVFQDQVIIDTNDTEALLVRKNNDGGDVFIVNTRDNLVISEGVLCANDTTEATSSSIAGAVFKGGVGIQKGLIVDGESNLNDDVTFTKKLVENFITTPTVSASLQLTDTDFNAAYYFQGYYYINAFDTSGGTRDLLVVDVSDPRKTPTVLSNFDLTGAGITGGVSGFYILNDVLYTFDFVQDELHAFDVRDKTSISIIGSLFLRTHSASSTGFSGKYAFNIGFGPPAGLDIIETIDISDPYNMRVVASVSITNIGNGTPVISENYMYNISSGVFPADYINIVDITDPYNLSLVSQTSTSDTEQALEVLVQGNRLFTFHEIVTDYLKVWDISDRSTPVFLGKYTDPASIISQPYSNIVQNNLVYMTLLYANAIGVFDVSDPTSIVRKVLIQDNEKTQQARSLSIDGQYMFLLGTDESGGNMPWVTILDLNGVEIQNSQIGNLKVANMRCELNSEFHGPVNMSSGLGVSGSITGQGGLASAQDITIGRINSSVNPLFTKTSKRTGSYEMTDATGPATLGGGDDLLFTGQKMFVIESYVEISADTDLWSHYRFVGVNESLTGDAWTMTVTRNGATDPNITFGITPAGQVQYTTPDYAGTITHAYIYYDITSNIF